MDSLRCNRLTCRRALTEKAVVTTCSHIFCVDCASELFNSSRLCPACDTSLIEPDDVVVCSLNPSNDYKTSVLSGLNPAIIVEICGRAMSFWQYQVHQEHSFQQAVIRNVNEKNAQLQKDLNNVIREANGELGLLNTKVSELGRDLELERRRSTSLQESLKEQEKEYQKLKAQLDRIKRKALLNPNALLNDGASAPETMPTRRNEMRAETGVRSRTATTMPPGMMNVTAVVDGMEANGVQRTPIVNRSVPAWRPMNHNVQARVQQQRQPFPAMQDRDTSFRTSTTGSDSANEVENLLGKQNPVRHNGNMGWQGQGQGQRRSNREFAPSGIQRAVSGFRPAGMMG